MGVLDWIRDRGAVVAADLQRVVLPRCPIPWRPNALAPVFWGTRDYSPTDGAPCRVRVFFPSLDGSPDSAAVLTNCGRYPLVLFAHGHCSADTDHFLKWIELPAQLARAGYVVAVPELSGIGGGDPPSTADADLACFRDLRSWMRDRWTYRYVVAPAPATGLVGHSFGALLAGRLAEEGEIKAFVSLSGAWDDWVGPPESPLGHIGAPKLFTWGFGAGDQELRVPLPQATWAALPPPKYRAVFKDLSHWDYLPEGRTACARFAGPCPEARPVAWDLVTMFMGNHLPPLAVSDLPGRIPLTLIPPALDLTLQQEFFAGGYLTGFGRLESTTNECQVSISVDIATGTWTVTKP